MNSKYTAVIKHEDRWWIGWVEEIPGVNSQSATREELLGNLLSALKEALAMNCKDAESAASGEYEEVSLTV